MNSWKEIVKTALLGTANLPHLPEQIFTDLKELGVDIAEKEQTEQRFLEALAVGTTFRKAGFNISRRLENLPYEPAEEETMPCCSPLAANYLSRILQNNQDEVLVEWLAIHQQLGHRIPEEQLPDVLAFGAMHEKLKTILLPALGNRGRWLARFNNRWAFALPETESTDDSQYHLGNLKERVEFLQKMRSNSPDQALQLLESTWPQEDYLSKAELIKVLALNLSNADMTFLENAWNDGRKEVRQEAAALLVSLPDSLLVKRLKAEMLKALNIKTGKDSKLSFEVNLPDKLSEELKRCGLREHFKPLPDGVKANWLAQLVSLIPTNFWKEQWGKEISLLLETAYEDDYRNVWFWGWATAAKKQNDELWIEAMHRFFMNQKSKSKSQLNFSLDFIYQDLSNALFNRLAWDYLQKDSFSLLADNHPAMILLLQEYQKWDNQLAIEVIARIRTAIANDSGVFNWNQKTLLKRAAYAIHPSLYEQMEKGWPSELGYSWQNEVTNFLATLRFRKEIYDLKV